MGSTEKIIAGIQKGLNLSVSGAMHTTMKKLQSPIERLTDSFEMFSTELNKSSKKTKELTEALVFWTKVMAIALIVQIFVLVLTIIIPLLKAQ